jgi:hypothetical protein
VRGFDRIMKVKTCRTYTLQERELILVRECREYYVRQKLLRTWCVSGFPFVEQH